MNLMKITAHSAFAIVVLLIIGFSFAIALSDNSITLSPKNKDSSKRVSVTDQSVIPVTGCMTLDKANRVYVLTKNIDATGAGTNCIKITSPGITFDGKGHKIYSKTFNGRGIYTNQENVDIKNINLDLKKVFEGISVESTTNVLIENVSIHTGFRGIILNSVSNSAITNSKINDNYINGYFEAIYLYQSDNNQIIGNQIVNNTQNFPEGGGIFMYSSNNNVIKNNLIKDFLLIPGPVIGFARGIFLHQSSSNLFVNNTLENIKEGEGGAGFGIGVTVEYGENNRFFDTIARKNGFGILVGSKSNQFIGGVLDSNNVGLSLSSSESNVFSDLEITNSSNQFGTQSNAGILLGSFLSNNTLSNIHVISFQSPDLMVYSNYQSESTIFENVELSSYSLVPEGPTLIINNANGEIKFLQSLSGTGSNFMNEIKIEQNKATIDASSNPGFDKPAQITLNSISLPYEPQSIRIMRNNQLCSSCNLISWNPEQMQAIFNVPGQGIYSIA